MKSIKTLAVGLGVLGALVAAPSSFAAPSLTFTDSASTTHVVNPFGGFDWASNATAFATALPFTAVNQTLATTTTYLAQAASIQLAGGGSSTPAGLGSLYEFTVKATIFETATCLAFNGTFCNFALFTATGGNFDIYFSATANANIVNGTGFVDGTRIIGGSILASAFGAAGSFNATSATTGFGTFNFNAVVDFTETNASAAAYFAPALVASNAIATLQIGGTQTAWTPPTRPNWGDGGTIGANDIVFQADGNQTFTAAVPEPGTLALVGLSLAGLGLIRRRRAAT